MLKDKQQNPTEFSRTLSKIYLAHNGKYHSGNTLVISENLAKLNGIQENQKVTLSFYEEEVLNF